MYLIRHGRPARTGVLLGSTDTPLAGEPISPSNLEVNFVFSSPLQRARRTAELLFPDRDIAVLPELAERGLGDWEGKRWEEIEAAWPDAAARASADWFGEKPPGGESWEEFTARVNRAWIRIRASSVCAVVAHAGVNAVLRHFATGADFVSFRQDYCEVISIAIPD